ncbi:MAG: four helix bundle protein [Ruminococcaceae bacterium]|nr:four helix bundle protein [Oscillospiraceae bacterium]
MKENYLIEKSLNFAKEIVSVYRYLTQEQNEQIISKQLLKSGTSIGANVNEANYAQSKADFVSKLHIALKETAETEYWIKLLALSDYIEKSQSTQLLNMCLELKRMLISSINTAKTTVNKE